MTKNIIKSIVGIMVILMVIPMVSMAEAETYNSTNISYTDTVYPTYTEITDNTTCVYTVYSGGIVGICKYNVQITGLTAIDKGTNYINWTWTNPTNSDFNNTIVNVTSGTTIIVSDTKISKDINYFNATGLSPNTEYTISVKTEDDAPAP